MKQRFHTIIKPEPNGWFVGWVEEIPGTITQARSLEQCRKNLLDSLQLMLQTHREEARIPLDSSCIQESLDIDVSEPASASGASGGAPFDAGPWYPTTHAYQQLA